MEAVKLSLQDQIKNANKCFYKREYEEFLEATKKIWKQNKTNLETYDDLFELVKKCLFCVHNNTELYNENYSFLINILGGMCYHKIDYSTAICFYFLGVMVVDKEIQCIFYNNIALVLSLSGKLELSEQYLKKAIEHGARTDRFKKTVKIFEINYIDCLFKQNKFSQAREVLEKVDLDLISNQLGLFTYEKIELLLDLEETDEFLLKIEDLKERIISSNNHIICLDINEFLLTNFKSLTPISKEKILLENLALSEHFGKIEFQRKYCIQLITLFKETKNKEKELDQFNKLYRLDSQLATANDGKYLDLFFEEISIFVNQLISKNKVISSQKKELEEITYILSHDLKTPLRTISSFSELIQKKIGKKEYSDLDEYLDYIMNSGKNLYNLVDDINLLHQVEQDITEDENIDLSKTVNQVIDLFDRKSSKTKGNIIIKNKLPVILGNASNYFIIFKNLIENGLKYNKSETPTVPISSKIVGNQLVLLFEDNGIGIDPEFHEYVFLYFKRLHNKEEYKGTGFGLGICRKIIAKHNGTITLDSKLNSGSTFYIHLPDSCLVHSHIDG